MTKQQDRVTLQQFSEALEILSNQPVPFEDEHGLPTTVTPARVICHNDIEIKEQHPKQHTGHPWPPDRKRKKRL
jgi:hypothetical protein